MDTWPRTHTDESCEFCSSSSTCAPGDTVMLIAPAGPPKREEVLRFKNHIEQRGYKVKMRDDIFDVDGYLAGTDERRAEEFNAAFADPESRRLATEYLARVSSR